MTTSIPRPTPVRAAPEPRRLPPRATPHAPPPPPRPEIAEAEAVRAAAADLACELRAIAAAVRTRRCRQAS